MKPLRDKIRDDRCRRCKLFKDAQSVCLIGEGEYPTNIAIVGEAPGFREDNIGKPFTGRADKKAIEPVLDKLGLDRSEVFLTYALHCKPGNGVKIDNDMIRACRYWLMKELNYVKPNKILVMGGAAAKSILDRYNLSVKSVVGKRQIVEMEWGEVEIQFTYHPGFIMRKPYMKKYFNEHFERFIADRDRTGTVVLPFNLKHFLSTFKSKVVVDVEDPDDKMNSLALTCKKGMGFWLRESEFIMASTILRKSSTIVGHNIKHDMLRLLKDGLISTDILYDDVFFDTLIGWNILDENCFDKSLKYLSYNYTDMVAYNRPEGDEWHDLNIVRPYNCKDVDATDRLHLVEKKMFKENPKLKIPLRIDLRVLNVIINIEYLGMKIDEEQLTLMRKDLRKKLKRITANLEIDNPNSRKQLSEALRERGFILPRTDKTRDIKDPDKVNFKTDKATLENLLIGEDDEDNIAYIKDVLDYGKYTKLESTFVNAIASEVDEDFLWYPRYFIAKREEGGNEDEGGTVTGRLSAKRFQQIPRDKETLERSLNPRRLFTVRDSRNILISADFSQMEMACAGVIYNEPFLLQIYDDGEDIHRIVASEVSGVKPQNVTKDQRKAAKTVNFGLIYGMTEFGLAKRLGWNEKQAMRYIKKYFKRLPGLEEGIENTKKFIRKNGFAETYFYRRRRLPGANLDDAVGRELIRQGVNSRVQGTAADICKICMWELFQRYRKYGRNRVIMLGNVHDETITETRKKYKKEVIEHIIEVYKDPPFEDYGLEPFPIQLRGDMKIGTSWFSEDLEVISF